MSTLGLRINGLIQAEIVRAMGMQAANQIAIQTGNTPPYNEASFSGIARYIEDLAREIT